MEIVVGTRPHRLQEGRRCSIFLLPSLHGGVNRQQVALDSEACRRRK